MCLLYFKEGGIPKNWNTSNDISLEKQMKRKLFVEGMRAKEKLPLDIGLKRASCPYGTVPIIRISKDYLARAKNTFKDIFFKYR